MTSFQMIKNLSEKTLDLRELADTIGAEFILTGGVETFKDRVRVSIELVKACTFEQIWSDSFDKRISQSNLFDLQDEITKSALDELQDSLDYRKDNLPKIGMITIGRVSERTYSS